MPKLSPLPALSHPYASNKARRTEIPDNCRLAINAQTKAGEDQMPSCPECAGEMVHESRADKLQDEGHTRSVETLGWWCTTCGAAVLDGESLRASEKQFLELKAVVDAAARKD